MKGKRNTRSWKITSIASVSSKKTAENIYAGEKANFEIRWKHFNNNGYKMKRAEQGGGVRSISLRRNASAQECLEELKNAFFPDDQTTSKENLEFQIG